MIGLNAESITLGDNEIGDLIGPSTELELISAGAAGDCVVCISTDQAVIAAITYE